MATTSNIGQFVPLDLLALNERGRIVDVEGEDAVVHRLEELGVRVGTIVQMLQLGSPCILGINDQRLSFRPESTTTVLIEVLPTGASNLQT